GYFFEGGIDDISLWNVALNSDQIQQFLDSELSGQEQGLVGYWNFNDGEASTLTDVSGNGNHGTINGATWRNEVPPEIGGNNSLSFDGSIDYVSIADNQSLTSTSVMTISAWFKKVSGSGWMSIVGKGTSDANEEYVLMLMDDQVYFDVGQGGGPYIQQSATIDSETWHHIAAVHTRSNGTSMLKVYLNGEDVGGTTIGATSTPNDNSHPLTIGSRFSTPNALFNGQIDDVRIWNDALDGQQIQEIMDNNLSGYEDGLIGHWDFNEGEGSFLTDLSGNGNDGSINGAVWSGDVFDNLDGSITFTKEDYADPSLAENQDRIIDNIWITRGNDKPLYNAAIEGSYNDQNNDHSISPAGTEWASGLTVNQSSILDYSDFKTTVGSSMQNLPGQILSLHIIGTDLYFDVEFHSWTNNQNGGGFSYTRTPTEGPDLPEGYFRKLDYSDPSLAENQDRITENVWITRGNDKPLYNAALEGSYNDQNRDNSISPAGTEWANGPTVNHSSVFDYKGFKSALGNGLQNLPGQTHSMHIIGTDIYFDVEFHAWTSGRNGGGFAYIKTQVSGPALPEGYFRKPDFADPSLAENQDRITDDIWIARRN
ncbi:MAG: LamG domain-containing protein, partial [Candidatus Marinimicrobia bacterium]|nr:LamG domain-containing protein [Candidatus Neomarinimicrobiota bacterium]